MRKTTKKVIKNKFDYKMAESLAKIFCTKEEIADIMDVAAEALEADDKFQKIYRKSIAEAKAKIRERELVLVEDKNPTIISLLAKFYLGQREKADAPDKELDYDVTKLPDFYLHRIVKGEDPIKVINEFENAAGGN
jgi:hypothetical protein